MHPILLHIGSFSIKTYGFLIATGLDQIRDLFAIVGDREGLDLYQGVQNLVPGATGD